jgi:flagellar FliL protein
MADDKQRIEKGEVKEETARKGLPVKLIVIMLVPIFLIAGGLIAWKKGALDSLLGSGQKEALAGKIEKKRGPPDMGPIYSLESFIVNLNEPLGKRYLKAKIELELVKEEVRPEIDRRLPQFRDAILTMLSSKSYTEISDLSGKFQLRAEIMSMLNSYLNTGKIANVYFTEFIVQ